MKYRILLVEDEAPVREMLKFALGDADYEVIEAADASNALALLRKYLPDLILLDWMLPGMSGIEFIRYLRRDASFRRIPVIMLTARGEEEDKVQGLQEGADDYLSKPFSTRELRARIQAVLRRIAPSGDEALLQTDDLCLDSAAHKVTIAGAEVSLGPTEFRLLHFFMKNPERVFSREQLLDNVWGCNVYVEERTVDVHIRRLRKVLAVFSRQHYIQTVRTVGYRFSVRAAS